MEVVTESDRSTSRAAPRVLGPVVDDMTRCVHYRTEVDIVAIRFTCCNEYYPCHRCHEETADHPAQQWKLSERDQEAALLAARADPAHDRVVPRDDRVPELPVAVQRALSPAHPPLLPDQRLTASRLGLELGLGSSSGSETTMEPGRRIG